MSRLFAVPPRLCFHFALLLAANAAPAQEKPVAPPATPAQTIEIVGKTPDETAQRRQSTAPTLVVGREEIERHGDASALDVLKRLPGVTLGGRPGRGGGLGMRGMGAWTQILIDGAPMPRGLSLDDLRPEQIERIEVTRSATAEHGARAVAGTINIVLREALRRTRFEASAGGELENGEPRGNVQVQHHDRVDALTYDIGAAIGRRLGRDSEHNLTAAHSVADGTPVLVQEERGRSRSRGARGNLNARLNWRGEGGTVLNLQPWLMATEWESDATATLAQALGATPAPWASGSNRIDGDSRVARLAGDWGGRAFGGRLNLRLNTSASSTDNHNTLREFDAAGAPSRLLETVSSLRERNILLIGKHAVQLGDGHAMTGGLEVERNRRRERAETRQDGELLFADSGDTFVARTQRLAVYAQDDWEISPRWAAYAGLRFEGIRTVVDSATVADRNDSRVWSPMLHSLWRLDDDKRTQVRASLARTYRSPNLADLIARPRPNARFPVDGANDATHPDRVGNPGLRPELAWGLDVALEHFPEAGGLLSANIFARRIDDLIRNVTRLEDVSWSPVPRWLTRPENLGEATSWGVELEAKARLDQWLTAAAPVDLRANLSRFWSRVAHVPGPDNRIEGQPELTLNLGADYRLKSLPLTIGGSLNLTPAHTVRRLENAWIASGEKRLVDLYAVWTVDPTLRLRAGLSNVLADDYAAASRLIAADLDQTTTTVSRSYRVASLRAEFKL